MFDAFLLGLIGSVTHCVGMCGGVMLLLGRGRPTTGWRRLALHAGRLTTYAGLGALAGALGHTAAAAAGMHGHQGHGAAGALPAAPIWQGALALLAALGAGYMALALLGRAPSVELLLLGITRWWGGAARGLIAAAPARAAAPGRADSAQGGSAAPARGSFLRYLTHVPAHAYLLGLFWGLLPCGLVLTALLMAAASGSPLRAAATMLAFGLGTVALGVGVGWIGDRFRPGPRWVGRLRPLAAALVLLFGTQMALRGLAAWGWVAHGSVGAVPLW